MVVLSEARRGMLGRGKERPRGPLRFLFATSLLMVLFSFYGAQASVFEKARESVLDTFEPVLAVVGAPVRWTQRRLGNVQDYFGVVSENERLRQENAELRAWMHEAVSLRGQIAYYEAVLDTHLPEPAAYVDAAVIGEAGGPFAHAMILSAGTADGVRDGSAVVDEEGLIGHVVETGRSASRVLLLTDFDSRTPVFIEGVGAEALMVGRAGEGPGIEFFADPPEDPIPAGTRVVTSGAGGLLPRGIPVGTIAPGGQGRVAVALYADPKTADLVRVVDFTFPQDLSREPTLPTEDAPPPILEASARG